MFLTVKLRLRDKHASELNRHARSVNIVWNYCNEIQQKAAREHRQWPSAFDLHKLTAGSSRELNLNSHTIQRTCTQYEIARVTQNKPWLRFRGHKSLGWIPLRRSQLTIKAAHRIRFMQTVYQTMHWHPWLSVNTDIRAGTFNQDNQGRWYLNLSIEVPDLPNRSTGGAVGIDLGLNDIATLSTGERVSNPRHYARLEGKLAKSQRANKKRLTRSILRQVANSRRDSLHNLSSQIASRYELICIGNVSSSALARTPMSKSVKDAGWSMLRAQLSYKAIRHGGRCIEVNERMTTQVCSSCGEKPEGRPIGIADLGIREWQCGDCGATHDRDVNAALNILRRGLATLAEGAAKERSSQTSTP